MLSALGSRVQLATQDTQVTNALRIVAGLMLATVGFLASIPVFIGQYGDGISWWPVLVPFGLAWSALGMVRWAGSTIKRVW